MFRLLVEFAPDERTYAVGRWFEPLRVVAPDSGHTTELRTPEELRRCSSACFTPGGDRVVAAGHSNDWKRTALTAWSLTGAALELPTAQWVTDRDAPPGIAHIWRITADDTHAALVANPGLVGLFALSDMRPICWIRTNGAVTDAAFDSSGRLLAVAGDAGLYLFTVHEPG
ncbi:hypothetical protein [Streptomyces vastus]|uniref:WD40 repeat domain-containing protein n=1 Tax=Streptomyces vastus TaxID=285451 RepID=A0ABN3R1C9_9ACTN